MKWVYGKGADFHYYMLTIFQYRANNRSFFLWLYNRLITSMLTIRKFCVLLGGSWKKEILSRLTNGFWQKLNKSPPQDSCIRIIFSHLIYIFKCLDLYIINKSVPKRKTFIQSNKTINVPSHYEIHSSILRKIKYYNIPKWVPNIVYLKKQLLYGPGSKTIFIKKVVIPSTFTI